MTYVAYWMYARGLSPRGRGKPSAACSSSAHARSIPAWAGETHRNRNASSSARVYPRVGGGNDFMMQRYGTLSGLSPRGRGKQPKICQAFLGGRSIPAWAGETYEWTDTMNAASVYPRVGGGNISRISTTAVARGLSPRGRGKHDYRYPPPQARGSIPAWAGETTRPSI